MKIDRYMEIGEILKTQASRILSQGYDIPSTVGNFTALLVNGGVADKEIKAWLRLKNKLEADD